MNVIVVAIKNIFHSPIRFKEVLKSIWLASQVNSLNSFDYF